MQLIQNGETVLLDSTPPLSEEQQELIRRIRVWDPLLSGMPETTRPLGELCVDALTFRQQIPDDGEPFTEINVTAVRQAIETKGLFLSEQSFALEAWQVLEKDGKKHGYTVNANTEIKPIEQRGSKFLGLN
jgi:hypothetical protein